MGDAHIALVCLTFGHTLGLGVCDLKVFGRKQPVAVMFRPGAALPASVWRLFIHTVCINTGSFWRLVSRTFAAGGSHVVHSSLADVIAY